MKQYFFNTILAILGFLIVIVPFTGKVHDGRRKWFKGFTYKGWIICIAFLLSVIVGYFKDLQADAEISNKDNQQKIDKRKDDSIARRRNDESNAKIVRTFTLALVHYGLKYDSAEEVIKKLVKDSSKRETKIYYGNHPELEVYNISIKKRTSDSLQFRITFITKQAAAYHTTAKVYIVFSSLHTVRKSVNYR